jgi:hypothetical protein
MDSLSLSPLRVVVSDKIRLLNYLKTSLYSMAYQRTPLTLYYTTELSAISTSLTRGVR